MQEKKELQSNRSQSLLKIVNPNVAYCLWPRASGKTFTIGDRIEHLSEVMPRSQILLQSDTYERLESRIVPNILSYFINDAGLVEGKDFVVFKKPPEHFERPIIPLKVYDHVISFASGLSLCLVSQKVEGSANAYNAQAMITDEAKYCDERKNNTETLPALRGAFNYYGHLPEYRSHWYFTDKFGENVRWLLAKKKLMNEQLIKAVITLQLQVFELDKRIAEAKSTETKYKYIHRKRDIESKLMACRKNLVYYCEAQPYENLQHLGEKYFRDLKRDLSAYEYAISVENKDPDTAEYSFYPEYSSNKHGYSMGFGADIYRTEPLIIALDYNWRITPLVAAQFGKLPGHPFTTLNFVDNVHTLHPNGGIELTVKEFCDKHYAQVNKHVYYVHDHTAIGKRPDGKNFADIVRTTLIECGWTYTDIYIGKASEHDMRFERFKKIFSNQGEMAIRMNMITCEPLKTSVQNAGAIQSMGKTKKDKSKEKNLLMDPVEQTDYSEAMDMIIQGALEYKLINPSEPFYLDIITR